jgi:hypothetical protein
MDVFFTANSDQCRAFERTILDNGGFFCDHLQNDKPLTQIEAQRKMQDGSVNFFVFGRRFDIFCPQKACETDLVWELRSCVEFVEIGTSKYPFLSREGITLVKLLWRRTKDIPDLEQMFAANIKALDLDYIEGMLNSMVSNDNDQSIKLFFKLKQTYSRFT